MSQRPVVVVVDDEQGVLDVVGRFATRAGFEVVSCTGGREALAQMQARHADLALVDLRMPDVGGLDVLRAIRERDPQCQTVLMTGYASVDSAVEALKMGARDYITKPFDFSRLERLLISVRDDAERRRALVAAERDVVERLEGEMNRRGPAMQELFAFIRRLPPEVRRELRQVIERACILEDGEPAPGAAAELPAAPYDSDPDLLTTVEREHIQRALARSRGNKKAAAKMLGLSRRALYRRLERLDLTATITRRPGGAGTLSL